MIGRILGTCLHGFLQCSDCGVIDPLFVISPAESVSGKCLIGQALACRLRERKRYVQVAAVLEHDIGKIICSQSVVRLDFQSFSVGFLGLLPTLVCLKRTAQAGVKASVAGILLNGLLVGGDGLID